MFIMAVLIRAGSAPADESGSRILFDQGHNQRFLIEQKGNFSSLLWPKSSACRVADGALAAPAELD